MLPVKNLAQPSIKRRLFEEALGYAERQKATTRCALCGAYTRGLVSDGKRWFEEHMERKHEVHVRRHR